MNLLGKLSWNAIPFDQPIPMLASGLKVTLPGVTGTLSVAFVFNLIGIEELTLQETLAMGCTATLLQCLWQAKRRPKVEQVLFNVSSIR